MLARNCLGFLFLVIGVWRPGCGTRDGWVQQWIHDAFCTQDHEFVSLPWDCGGFLYCGTTFGQWLNCAAGLVFNNLTKRCAVKSPSCQNLTGVALTMCPRFPSLKFAHSRSCSMYYDCSKTTSSEIYGLARYEEECRYPRLFDSIHMACVEEGVQTPVTCSSELKPKQRCEYVKECTNPGTPIVVDPCETNQDGYQPDPAALFTNTYLNCVGGRDMGRYTCTTFGSVFDPETLTCVTDFQAAAERYCSKHPSATFSHPRNCALYYDCSRASHYDILPSYTTECRYLHLYDVPLGRCVRFDQLTVPCGFRAEPKAPCDYQVTDCFGGQCMPCSASCVGLRDGDVSYPSMIYTRFHLSCQDERTIEIKKCDVPKIFVPSLRSCGHHWQIGQTPAPSTQPTTPSTQPTTPSTRPTTLSTRLTAANTQPQTTPWRPTTASTQLTTTDQRTTAPTVPPTCSCDAELEYLNTTIDGLKLKVDSLENKVNETTLLPSECVKPPSLNHSRVQVIYRSDVAEAEYTCDKGYTLCGKPDYRCLEDDLWDGNNNAECVQTVFTNLSVPVRMDFPCKAVTDMTFTISGRPTSPQFNVGICDFEGGPVVLNASVEDRRLQFFSGESFIAKSPVSLAGLQMWSLRRRKKNLEVAVNGYYVGAFRHPLLDMLNCIAISDGFEVTEIQFFYDGRHDSLMGKYPLQRNLAFRKPASASSSGMDKEPARAVNGIVDLSDNTADCWIAAKSDSQPRWNVDLGDIFYIRKVAIAAKHCSPPCDHSTDDFYISVGMTYMSTFDDAMTNTWCTKSGAVTPGTTETLECETDAVGRHVSIWASSSTRTTQLTLCEVEVYGGRIQRGESPYDCSDPPLVPGASVSVSYNVTHAAAKYTCDTDYVMCSKNDVIYCSDNHSWLGRPDICIKRVTHEEDGQTMKRVQICPLSLGGGLEVWLTPISYTGRLETVEKEGDPSVLLPVNRNDLFPRNKPSRVVVQYLTNHVQIGVNHQLLDPRAPNTGRLNKASAVLSSFSVNINSLTAFSALMPGVVRETVLSNLALHKNVTASNNETDPPSVAVDGTMAFEDGDTSRCWRASQGDKEQWLLIDLELQYYIREVAINVHGCFSCGLSNKLSDFTILVYDDVSDDSRGLICNHFRRSLPINSKHTITCLNDVWGRYVKLRTDDISDVMTVCEVEVYGDRAVAKEWSPMDCPVPPQTDYGSVSVEYFPGKAVAVYTCNESFTNHPYEDVICSSTDGWTGPTHPCIQRRFFNPTGLTSVDLSVPLRLGEGLEIHTKPKPSSEVSIQISDSEDEDMFTLTINCGVTDCNVTLSPNGTTTDGSVDPEVNTRIWLTFLSGSLSVDVNGKRVYDFRNISSMPKIKFIKGNAAHRVNVLSRDDTGIQLGKPGLLPVTGTRSSSGNPSTSSAVVVDGNFDMSWPSLSCWATGIADLNPWWEAELDLFYYITGVGITSRDTIICLGDCRNRLHDFEIHVYHEAPETGSHGELCFKYEGIFPHSVTSTVPCDRTVYGRFLRLSSPGRFIPTDILTLCEVQIFGGSVTRKAPDLPKCPPPPLSDTAFVHLSHNTTHVKATYTCMEGHQMCTGNNVIYCADDSTWEGKPGECVHTNQQVNHGHVSKLTSVLPVCPMKLGEAIEMWIRPKAGKSKLFFNSQEESDRSIMELDLDLTLSQMSVLVEGEKRSGSVDMEIGQEVRLALYFGSDSLLIVVNNMTYVHPHGTLEIPNIKYIESSDSLHMRKVRPIPLSVTKIIKVNTGNIALKKATSASSVRTVYVHGNVADGNTDQDGSPVPCWHPEIGDTDQWLQIDLDGYFIIREMKIYNRLMCNQCEDRLHDFYIYLLHTSNAEDTKSTCLYYEGVFPIGAVEVVQCDDAVWGRYVRFTPNKVRDSRDLMTLCEVEVYGESINFDLGTEVTVLNQPR